MTRILIGLAAVISTAACSNADPPTVEIGAKGLSFNPTRLEIPAGTDVRLSKSMNGHSFAVSGTGLRAENSGRVSTSALPPGTYLFVCDVPGHEAAGMVGEIEVLTP